MLSKIEKTAIQRKRARLKKRRQRNCFLPYEESKFDIPKDFEVSKYWSRWADMKRDIEAACARFWEKRKRKNAHFNKRSKLQRKKLPCEIFVFTF